MEFFFTKSIVVASISAQKWSKSMKSDWLWIDQNRRQFWKHNMLARRTQRKRKSCHSVRVSKASVSECELQWSWLRFATYVWKESEHWTNERMDKNKAHRNFEYSNKINWLFISCFAKMLNISIFMIMMRWSNKNVS